MRLFASAPLAPTVGMRGGFAGVGVLRTATMAFLGLGSWMCRRTGGLLLRPARRQGAQGFVEGGVRGVVDAVVFLVPLGLGDQAVQEPRVPPVAEHPFEL